jgi:hypothetical protein
MTPKALELLKRLIEVDRWWRTRHDKGERLSRDDRGIEVSRIISGIDPRTAEQLVKLGIAEIVNIGLKNPFIFLGKYDPYDPYDTTGLPHCTKCHAHTQTPEGACTECGNTEFGSWAETEGKIEG